MWTIEFGKLPIYVKRKHKKKNCTRDRTVYSVIRPMAVLAKLLGTFPLSGVVSSSADKLQFHLLSCGIFWGFFLFSGIIFFIVWTSKFFITYSKQNSVHFWKVVYCWLVIARAILQFFFCNFGARNIPQLLQILDKSFICRQTDSVVRPWKSMPFLVFVGHISFITYLDYTFFGSLMPDDNNNAFTGSLFSFLRIWQIIPSIMYVHICRIMIKGFQLIDEKVSEIVLNLKPFYKNEAGDSINKEEVGRMVEKIEWLRLEHALLNKASEALSKSYGIVLLIDYTAIIVLLVVQLYVIVIIYEIDWVFILCALTNFVSGTSAIHVSHDLIKNSETPLDSLLSVAMHNLNRNIRYQIRLFQNQVSVLKVKVSAGGFFKLDRKRIIAMMGTVATYFIILLEYGDSISQGVGVTDNETFSVTF